MGRFFQTAPTQFVDNYIYQPPWELMQQAAAQKQKVYDTAIASTKLFDNIPIEHLQGEDDVYNVQEKQRYYAENGANIAKAIQNDPSKAQQYLNNIDLLQKELQKDFTTGDISKIQGSAQAYKKWQEDNKKRKEDDASRYTAAERAYLGEYLNAGGNSLSQGFRGEQVTKDVDWNKINDMAEKLKTIFKEKGYEFYIDSPTNQQFFIVDNKKLEELEKYVRYGFWEKYDDTHTVVRFATSWATTEESIEKLKELL